MLLLLLVLNLTAVFLPAELHVKILVTADEMLELVFISLNIFVLCSRQQNISRTCWITLLTDSL